MAYHPVYGRVRQGPPGYYISSEGFLIPEQEVRHRASPLDRYPGGYSQGSGSSTSDIGRLGTPDVEEWSFDHFSTAHPKGCEGVGHREERMPEYSTEYEPYPSDFSLKSRNLESKILFGGGFTPTELASSALISGVIAFLLGAGLPGALVMGIGSMVVEAGSGQIPVGWKRYVLGLFRKPH